MATLIPDNEVRFAQLAVKQRYLQPEQVRSALELYRCYQAAGGEVPSIPRILVGKGWLDRQKAEVVLRHIIRGEPLPAPIPRPLGQRAGPPVRKPSPAAGVPAELDLELPGDAGPQLPESDADMAASAAPAAPLADDREAWIKGMGATVVRRDLVKGYKIVQVRGEGSMGTVYKAHQLSMDRTVALKVLPPEKTKDQRFVEEFLAEARNSGRLNHPNLIHVHEVNKCGDVYYYSMEYVEGQRLDEWMDECEGGRVDPKQVVLYLIQVCAALDYGFRAGVIHREIRPNAIMVNDDGQAKLADLGLTKGEESRFLDGENCYYVAPEQLATEPVDTRADIYSLGCCLFHCLTGETPFTATSPKEVLRLRLTAPTPDPAEYNADLPPGLCKVVMKMMARKPADRYQTPADVAEALRNVNFAPAARKRPLGARGGLRRPGMGARPALGHKTGGASGKSPLPRPQSGRNPPMRDKRRPGH